MNRASQVFFLRVALQQTLGMVQSLVAAPQRHIAWLVELHCSAENDSREIEPRGAQQLDNRKVTKLESEKQLRAAQEVHVSPIPAFPIPAFSIPATLAVAVAEPVGVADAAGLLLTASASRRGL